MIRRLGLMAVAFLAVFAAGCTSTDKPPVTTLSSNVGRLDPVAPFRDRPCSLLTLDQWSRLGFDGDGQEVVVDTCMWKKTQPNRSFSLGLTPLAKPLEVTCEAKNGDAVESVTISGYPAWRCVESDGRGCQVALDTRQEQKIHISVGGENEDNWCAKAATTVGYIVQNLHG